MSTRRLVSNTAFSLAAKAVNAGIQIVCLPVLLRLFGKSDYGLIAIALSLNTFVAIMQLGLPSGIPRFIAQWLGRGEHASLRAAMRTVAGFYLAIALLNFFILTALAVFGIGLFNISPDRVGTLQTLLVITAATSLLAIPATALEQMLTGAQELGFVSRWQMAGNLVYAGLVAFVYVRPDALSLTQFYGLRCLLMFLPVPFSLARWCRYGRLDVFIPAWDWRAVLPLLKYSLSVLTFGIFITIRLKFSPIILATRTTEDAGAVMADFSIINYFHVFITMISGAVMAALIPHLCGAVARGDDDILRRSIMRGTKIVWGFGALLGFGMIMLAGEGLSIYVGPEYLHLRGWLMLYLATSLYYLYNTALASAILSSDKLAPLVWATGVGCLVSLAICWHFAPRAGVGSIPLGAAGYMVVYFCVTHFWYFPKYFKINPVDQIFRVLLPPAVAGTIMYFAGRGVIAWFGSANDWINIALGAASGTLVYGVIILAGYLRPRELWDWINQIRRTEKADVQHLEP